MSFSNAQLLDQSTVHCRKDGGRKSCGRTSRHQQTSVRAVECQTSVNGAKRSPYRQEAKSDVFCLLPRHNWHRHLFIAAMAFLCSVFLCACGKRDKESVYKKQALQYVDRIMVVNSEMLIHRVKSANGVDKYIITPPPGFRNRFTLEKIQVKAGARFRITKIDWRRHWSGYSGAVPIVQLLDDDRLMGIEMEFRSVITFNKAQNELNVDSVYLRLLPTEE